MDTSEPTIASNTGRPPSRGGPADRTPSAEDTPAHLRAPTGVPQEVHEINLIIGVLTIGAHTNYRWLNRDCPNVDAAKVTVGRMVTQVQQLNDLVSNLNFDTN